MKRFLSLALALICLLFATIQTVSAENELVIANNTETNSYTEYYEDGSYVVTTICQSVTPRSSTYIQVSEKKVEMYNSSDELQWRYKFIARFDVVEGVSVECIESTYTSDIYVDSWSLTAHNNYYSGNTAYATATYKKKVLFITTNTHDIDLDTTCDVYGNID